MICRFDRREGGGDMRKPKVWNGLDPKVWGALAHWQVIDAGPAPSPDPEAAAVELLDEARRLFGLLGFGEGGARAEAVDNWLDRLACAAVAFSWWTDPEE